MKNDRPRLVLRRLPHRPQLPLLLGLCALGALGLSARPAEARLIDLHVGALGGGLTGWGQTPNTPDFFDRRKGPGLGLELGVKLLIFDVSGNFVQLFDSSGRAATLSQVLAGVSIDVPVGNQKFQEGVERGRNKNVLRPIANIGFAAGTPEPVHPPLTAADSAWLQERLRERQIPAQ